MDREFDSANDRRVKMLYYLFILLAVLVNLSAIDLTFFTDDPALYGSIAKQLIYKHEFLQLFSYGKDWLDKPHLPFWLIFFSFKLFGISSWSYRLPALICFLISLRYTYLFAKKFYSTTVALTAVLIVSTSLHIIMSNADVRAEPFLMCFITGAIFHISRLEDKFTLGDLLMAALLTAFGIMSKGIFIIVPVYGAILGQLVFSKKYADLLNIKWLALILLTLLFITPELYALYIQFDMHPEKLVFNQRYVSGLKWFFWDSQFGRFVNGGPIKRSSGSIFFFFHTLLWAFAPWCLLFFYAAFKNIKSIVNGQKLGEYYSLSGGLIMFLLFSVSGFQLPFYTNILFPLFAVITANFLVGQVNDATEQKFKSVAMGLYITLLPILIILIDYFLKPANNKYFIAALLVLIACYLLIFRSDLTVTRKFFLSSCAVMVFVGIFLNVFFQPLIIKYKGEPKAADFVNKQIGRTENIYSLSSSNNGFQFYCERPIGLADLKQFDAAKIDTNSVFYIKQDLLDSLAYQKRPFKIIESFLDYPHENIRPSFINFKTRSSTLKRVYLIKQRN